MGAKGMIFTVLKKVSHGSGSNFSGKTPRAADAKNIVSRTALNVSFFLAFAIKAGRREGPLSGKFVAFFVRNFLMYHNCCFYYLCYFNHYASWPGNCSFFFFFFPTKVLRKRGIRKLNETLI